MTLLALSVCYLVLFNPRTEPNSYIILAPSLAYFAYYAPWRIASLVLILIFAHTVWQQVLPAIIFTGLVVYWIFRTPLSIQLQHEPCLVR
jgi:hypothetical protein